MTRNIATGLVASAALLLLAAAPQALAQSTGTAAGTTISNSATVSFKVNEVTQTAPAAGVAEFLVDRRVDLTVAEVGGAATPVSPGGADKAVAFVVTNNTNDIIDVGLVAVNAATGTKFQAGTVADTTDDREDNVQSGTTFRYFVDDDGTPADDTDNDGVLTITGTDADTELTDPYLDQLEAGDSRTVFVVATMPLSATDGQIAVIKLTGQARRAYTDVDGPTLTPETGIKGAVLVADTDADDPTLIENVFADSADTEGTGDPALDGKDSSYDAYLVGAASITVNKQSVVYWDFLNGKSDGTGVEPKAIPGAAVLYCVSVLNEGGAGATDVVIGDVIPTGTTFVASDADLDPDGTGVGQTLIADTDGIGAGTTPLGISTGSNIRFSASESCTAAAWDAALANASGDPAEQGDVSANPWIEGSGFTNTTNDDDQTDGRVGNYATTPTPKLTTTVDTLGAGAVGTPTVTTTMFMVKVN